MTVENRALVYVEADLDYCSLRYGETTAAGTCPAVLGVDSPHKCFNTLKTCAVPDSFTNDPVTYRWAKPASYLPRTIDAIPSIEDVDISPSVISLGENLGQRASVSVTFLDHPWPDTGPGYDKYVTERPYDPFLRGSYFGKFRARQPYVRGRKLRVYRGRVGQTLEEMETRHYVIEDFDGPSPDGRYRITAKDILKLADNDRAQAPFPSEGYLDAGITAVAALLELAPNGAGAEYAASGYVNIGNKEIAAFTRDATGGNDDDTILLAHMDGADGSTTFTDVSPVGRTLTAANGAQVDTAQSKFGGASALFDGTDNTISFPDAADLTFAGDFTIDCWIRASSLAATRTVWSHPTDTTNNYDRIYVTTGGALTYQVRTGGSNLIALASSAGAIVINTWYHVAIVRSGNAWALYIDGVSVATTTDGLTMTNRTGPGRIGTLGTATEPFAGHIDEFRISIVARWTAGFTPPVAAYSNGDELTLTARGALGTTAVAHDAEELVQTVLYYQGEDPADILADLFETYAGIDAAYIPLSNWLTETDAYLDRVYTAVIASPTGVNELASELIEQAGLIVWWSDIDQEIRLRVLRAVDTTADTWTPDTVIEGSLDIREQPDKRISQVWVFYGPRDPLRPLEDPDNYRSGLVQVDTASEEYYGSPAIRKIFSRWIPPLGRTTAERLAELLISGFANPPRQFSFALHRDAGEAAPVMLGSGYRLEAWPIQDDTGAAVAAPLLVTSLDADDGRVMIEAQESLFTTTDPGDLINRTIIIDADDEGLNILEIHDNLYPELTAQDVIDGVTLTVTVQSGVLIGSLSVDIPAITIPAGWPVGFVPVIINNGTIGGAGGAGSSSQAVAGTAGGVGLLVETAIDLDNSAGIIRGGGGGGGAGQNTFAGQTRIAGGGGGAGIVGGVRGTSVQAGGAQDGTETAGGNGAGASVLSDSVSGGDGGDPGQAGSTGARSGGTAPQGFSAGGAAGAAIDGDSLVSMLAGDGTITGSRIN